MTDSFLQCHYDLLWSASAERIRSGSIEIDPVLARKVADRRRGMTLAFRPSQRVKQRVIEFLDEVRQLEPDQYFYDPSELHVTFLGMFTATETNEALFARTDEYVAAVAAGVSEIVPFQVYFSGVTVSPGTILIQGFTEGTTLNTARDNLRRVLRSRGLGDGLDRRYRLETAHMTVARFRQSLRDGETFAKALDGMRRFDFGESTVDSLELVKTDWYMSRRSMEVLGKFTLSPAARDDRQY